MASEAASPHLMERQSIPETLTALLRDTLLDLGLGIEPFPYTYLRNLYGGHLPDDGLSKRRGTIYGSRRS